MAAYDATMSERVDLPATASELDEVLAAAWRSTISSGGVDLAVLTWPGDDDVLVLAHATGFHKELWAPVVAHLRRLGAGATIVAVDLRGHGDSTMPALGPSVWDYGGDLAVVGAAAGARTGRRVGVGHSLGGMAVTAAELLEPGTFDGLVLLDPALVSPARMAALAGANPWADAARRRKRAFASPEEAFAGYRAKPVFAPWPDEVLRLYVTYGFHSTPAGWAPKCSPDWEAATFSQPDLPEVWERLPALDVPVTLVTAGDSTTHSETVAAELARRLDAKHHRLEGASHFLPMEAPAAVARSILERLELPAEPRDRR